MIDIGWSAKSAQGIIDLIRPRNRVTITNRFGQTQSGSAVMRSPGGGWVLNCGGRHGTPRVVTADNFVACPAVWRGKQFVGHPIVDGSLRRRLRFERPAAFQVI